MKYYVTGLVRCLAGIVVEADTFDGAVIAAKKECLKADPIEHPYFEVASVECTDALSGEPIADHYDFADEMQEDVEERIEENEKVCNEDGDPSEEEVAAVKEKIKKACCRLNKNKKCCGKCDKKPEIEGFMFVSDHPLIDWLESITGGDDEWDFV